MDDPGLKTIEELFQAAADLPPGERAGFLDRATLGGGEVRRRVEAMLAQLDRDETLERPRVDHAPLLEGPGTVIDRYKLLQKIGEGGFGVVYMAEQQEPVVRKVALKVIKLGMDTREVVARFEAERQALALMDHPSIAKVLDGGATATGRPYFVMELVRGIAITDYCDQNQLETRERLELLIQVCHAVQHAHQKGVIHRDLKPSNVLVTLHDGRPMPKVIDFGVAKAMHTRLTEKTLFTAYQRFIGTPAYMSPEQAEMSALDVDTRTDIYALGVLLYELLTGTTPFDTATLARAGLVEIQRILREEQPPRPSLRISTSSAADLAGRRRLDVKSLARRLRGDLDWIAMKALAKERTRRYQTAGELADDVRRHLDRQPVLAGPPGAAYRLRKLLERRRAAVLTAAALLVVLAAGVAGTVRGMLEAARQRDAARQEAANAKLVTDFLVDTLALTDPSVVLDPSLSVRTLLDRAAARVADAFADQPRAEARLRATIGRAYATLGENELAEAHLRRSVALVDELGIVDAADFYDTLWTLTHVLFRLERPDAYGTATRARVVGHDHVRAAAPGLAHDLDRFARAVSDGARDLDAAPVATAHSLLRAVRARAERELDPGDPRWLIVADTFTAAGYDLWYTAHEPASEPFWNEALAIRRRLLPPGHPDVAEAVTQLVAVLNRAGKAAEAESHIAAAVASLRAAHPEGSSLLAVAEAIYGETLVAQARYAEAEPLLLASHEVLDTGDDVTFYAMDSLGRLVALYDGWGRPELAEPYRARLPAIVLESPWGMPWPIARHAFAPGKSALRAAFDRIDELVGGVSYSVLPGSARPEGLAEAVAEAVALRRRLVADETPLAALAARFLLVWSHAVAPDAAGGARRRMVEEAYAILGDRQEELPAISAEALSQLAELEADRGDHAHARQLGRRAWVLIHDAFAEPSWLTALAQLRIAQRLLTLDLFAETESLLVPGYALLAAQLGEGQADVKAARELLAELYQRWGKPEQAARYRSPSSPAPLPAGEGRSSPPAPLPAGEGS